MRAVVPRPIGISRSAGAAPSSKLAALARGRPAVGRLGWLLLCGGVIAAGRRWAGRRSAGVRISARPKIAAPEPPTNCCGSAKGWQPGPSDDARPANGPADHGAGPGCVCVLPHTIGGAPHRRPQAGRPLGAHRPQGAGGGRPRFSPPAAGERPAEPALEIARPQRARGTLRKARSSGPRWGRRSLTRRKKGG